MEQTDLKKDSFDFMAFANNVMRRWRLVLLLPAAAVLLTAVVMLLIPNKFTARIIILPMSGRGDMMPIMQIAGQMGLSGLNSEASINNPQIVKQIIESELMVNLLAQRTYYSPRAKRQISLAEVLKVKERDTVKYRYKLYRSFHKAMLITTDIKTRTVDVAITVREPVVAAGLANAIAEEFDAYNKTFRNSKARSNRQFMEKRLTETKEELARAEKDLEHFRERNRKLSDSPQLQTALQRLLRNLKVQEELFVLLTKEYEMARLQEVKDTPVIDIIERAQPPARKSEPKRTKMVLIMGLLSLAVAVLAAWALEYNATERPLETIRNSEGFSTMAREIGAYFKRGRRV